MAYTQPISRTAIENALIAWILRATGLTPIWEAQDSPQPTSAYASLRWVTGASKIGQDSKTMQTDLTRASDIKVTPIASNNTTYTVTLNGNPYQYLSDGTATVAEICTGLCAAITEPDITCTDNATDFDITEDTGGVYTVVLTDDDTGSLMSWVLRDTSSEPGKEIEINVGGPRLATLAVTVHVDAATVALGTGADYYMDIIAGSIDFPTEREARQDVGLALHSVNPPVNLDGIAGDGFVERRQMDIFLSMPSNMNNYFGYIAKLQISSTELGWTNVEFGDV